MYGGHGHSGAAPRARYFESSRPSRQPHPEAVTSASAAAARTTFPRFIASPRFECPRLEGIWTHAAEFLDRRMIDSRHSLQFCRDLAGEQIEVRWESRSGPEICTAYPLWVSRSGGADNAGYRKAG